jgi:hypothetical protein
VCAEEVIPFTALGDLDDTLAMGPQPIEPFLEIIRDAAETDLGVVHERSSGLAYAPRATRYNQPVSMTLDISAGDLADAPEPTDDDQRIGNEINASNRLGHESAVLSDEHIRRYGRYDSTVSANTADRHTLRNVASWLLHLGTIDNMRWPQISFDLDREGPLTDQWLSMPPGGRLKVPHALPQIAGVDIDVVVEGSTQKMTSKTWDVEVSCSPAAPWDVWELEHPERGRIHPSGATLMFDLNTTEHNLAVLNHARQWITWANHQEQFPFFVNIGGEIMRVNLAFDWPPPAPGTPITDSFTASDGSLQTANTDLNWTNLLGQPGQVGTWRVLSNQISPNGAIRGANNYARAEHDRETVNHYAEIDVTQLLGSAANEVGPCVRFANSAATCYMATIRRADSTTGPHITIQRSIAGQRTSLTTPVTVPLSLPARLRIEADGPNIRAYWAGELVASVVDGAITSGRKTGVFGTEAVSQGQGVIADNFEAGDLPPNVSATLLSVTRGFNGIVTEHTQGTPVRLASRHTVAL